MLRNRRQSKVSTQASGFVSSVITGIKYSAVTISMSMRTRQMIGSVSMETGITSGEMRWKKTVQTGIIQSEAETETEIRLVTAIGARRSHLGLIFLMRRMSVSQLLMCLAQSKMPSVETNDMITPISPAEKGLSAVSTRPAAPSEFTPSLLRRRMGAP